MINFYFLSLAQERVQTIRARVVTQSGYGERIFGTFIHLGNKLGADGSTHLL